MEELRGSITPLVCSTDSALHPEYTALQRRMARRFAAKWERSRSAVMAWVRARTQMAIVRAVDLRLRGTWRRLAGLSPAEGLGPII